MSPFDLKSALLARHAQHVVLIHFPIALLLAGVAFDLAAHWSRRQALAAAAHYNLLAAALCSVPALATGLLAWRWQLEGQALKGLLLLHLALAAVTSALMWAVAWVHWRAGRQPEAKLPAYRLPLELLAAAAVAVTAHLGGFLSGVNAPG